MICEEVMELMQRHLDGDLNSEELERLTEHLDTCSECAEMMERLESIDRDLASLPKVTPAYSLVDAILPRLQELDAADGGELAADRNAAPAVADAPGEGGFGPRRAAAKRPWYARRSFAGIGGAAAAAVLGILIVNGLPQTFDDAARTTSEESAAGASAETMMMDAMQHSAASEQAAPGDMESASSADPGGGAGGSVGAADEAPTPRTAEPRAERDDPVDVAETPRSGSEPASIGGGEKDASEEPTDGSESTGNDHATEGDRVGDVSGDAPAALAPEEAEGASEPRRDPQGFAGPSAGDEADTEKHDAAPPEGAEEKLPGIAAIPEEPAPTEKAGKWQTTDQYGGSPAFVSEDGAFAAYVKQEKDGTKTVVVDQVEGDADFASAYTWTSSAYVELRSWDGHVLTYTVSADTGIRTFAIDADAVTETEIE